MTDRAAECRAAREAFEQAMAQGCTPREAERRLRRQRAEARQACGRSATTPALDSEPLAAMPPARFHAWNAHWMMRD